MSSVSSSVDQLRAAWSAPRTATHRGEPLAVPVICTFDEPADEAELSSLPQALPPDLLEFWRAANGASLFEDTTYGQWGLRLHSVRDGLAETARFNAVRPEDALPGDFVIGKFLGDSDVLLVRTDPEAADYGAVVVALPLDSRDEWDDVSPSFGVFLARYADAQGHKFWR